MNGFPQQRLRRLRSTAGVRALVRETHLSREDFIHPVFLVEERSAAGPVASMPGVERHSEDSLLREIDATMAAGIPAVLLFGVPAAKDAKATRACDESGLVPRAIRRIRESHRDLVIFTDVCLCSYTDHGHCGIVSEGGINNDATLEVLARTAVAHARAGADFVAPSGMMDGMVAALRAALDDAGCAHTGILSYAVKYASAFYGPFRDAAESTPAFGDRRTYQMDPANAREALAEARLDVEEGADMIMVKPALPYLDVIRRVSEAVPDRPLTAYQVSGEYSMIQAAAGRGWLDQRAVALESLTAIKRAGAAMIISYFARQAATWLAD